MAQTVYCEGHPDTAASMLIQELGTPNVMTLCAACVIAWCTAIVDATSGGPPEQPTGEHPDIDAAGPITSQEMADQMAALDELDAAEMAELAQLSSTEPKGGDEHDGDVRALDRGVEGSVRSAPGEAGPADQGAGGGTVAGRRTGNRRAAGGANE